MTDPRHVVLQHTHHKDDGVYRLVVAKIIDEPIMVEVSNPDFNPDHPENLVYEHLSDGMRHELVFGEPPKPNEDNLNKADQAKVDAIPVEGINSRTRLEEQTRQIVLQPFDIVFADDDERWADKTPNKIAAEQRKIVRQQLEKNAAEAKKAARQKQRATADLGGAGEDL